LQELKVDISMKPIQTSELGKGNIQGRTCSSGTVFFSSNTH